MPKSGCSNDLVNPFTTPSQLTISPFLSQLFPPFCPNYLPFYPNYFTLFTPIISPFLPCFTRAIICPVLLSSLVSGYPWPWRHSKLKLNPEWGRGRPGVQYLFNLKKLNCLEILHTARHQWWNQSKFADIQISRVCLYAS